MLGLSSCQDTGTSIIFDTDSGDISLPNDLWFLGSDDGTLNIDIDEDTNSLDYIDSLNALDGWSTHTPFEIPIAFPIDVTLDSNSIDGDSVQLYEVTVGEDCFSTSIDSYEACSIENTLTYGTDYLAEATVTGLKVSPLSPLAAKTTYLLVLTDSLTDSDGNPVQASDNYQQLQLSIDEFPMDSEEAQQIQGIINSYENVASDIGIDKQSIIYTMAMTTQSAEDVLLTVKDKIVEQGAADLTVAATGYDLATLLTASGYELTDTQELLFSTGDYYSGSLTLPYYSGISTEDDPYAPLTDHWSASEIVGSEYNLTQYNTSPQENTVCNDSCISNPGNITVQMTVPSETDAANAVRSAYGLDSITEPADGWPVVILQHGVTSKKSDMLAITGILSLYGFATVAIDLPLHGDRGFDLDNDGTDDISATNNSYADYINLTSLLTTRDNVRQGIADLLGLRYALQNISGANINATDVQFMGHSLGAITGISFGALANMSTGNDATDAQFAIDSISLAAPGVGIASFLMESSYFGGAIESGLAYAYDEDFQTYVSENGYTTDDLESAYDDYYASLSEDAQSELSTMLSNIVLAAQTTIDNGDPVNYTASLATNGTNMHVMEITGNGTENYSDLVIPNEVDSNPNAGTEAAINQLDMTSTDQSSYGHSFAVRFAYGHHSSVLSTENCTYVTTTDSAFDLCEEATTEMQSEMASFLYSRGQYVAVSNSAVIEAVE
jgi:hypothetical protein